MPYDPLSRGPFAVGVRTIAARRGDRELPTELWYPATAESRDAAPERGRFPATVFSHTSGGHRRQSSFLCAHLASHGYVVAAPDHVGSTAEDAMRRAAEGPTLTGAARDAFVRQLIADRVPDLRLVIDALLSTKGLAETVDGSRVGLVGYSFGGWAVLATPEADDRISAIVAMVPAGNSRPLPGIIPATLTFEWTREVATLFLAAERDKFTPPAGVRELLERAPSPKRMFVLRGAGHQHFADVIDDPEGCAPENAHRFATTLALAHLDSSLKANAAAAAFLRDDPLATLRARGVDATEAT